jgi:hypothetical protein
MQVDPGWSVSLIRHLDAGHEVRACQVGRGCGTGGALPLPSSHLSTTTPDWAAGWSGSFRVAGIESFAGGSGQMGELMSSSQVGDRPAHVRRSAIHVVGGWIGRPTLRSERQNIGAAISH